MKVLDISGDENHADDIDRDGKRDRQQRALRTLRSVKALTTATSAAMISAMATRSSAGRT